MSHTSGEITLVLLVTRAQRPELGCCKPVFVTRQEKRQERFVALDNGLVTTYNMRWAHIWASQPVLYGNNGMLSRDTGSVSPRTSSLWIDGGLRAFDIQNCA